MKKGDTVHYTSGLGFPYTARIRRAHRDGSFSIMVAFPIRDGQEMEGCHQGDKFRVPARMVRPLVKDSSGALTAG